jgi:CDP-glucose 4,6-dehydratase
VQWIVEYLCSQVPDATWQCDTSPQPHEAHTLKLDSSKAKSRLGWYPRWDLKTALGMTLAWHQGWKRGADLTAITVQQIQTYEASSRRS